MGNFSSFQPHKRRSSTASIPRNEQTSLVNVRPYGHSSSAQLETKPHGGWNFASISIFPGAPISPKNNTGLPDVIKSGITNKSGISLDDVRVHYNSSKPAQVQALAYTQGTDIYIGPSQERHLAHEAWHVVQQKQGRVKPTLQLRGVAINDDSTLEREADESVTSINQAKQGEATAQMQREGQMHPSLSHAPMFRNRIPLSPVVQRTTYTYNGKEWLMASSSSTDTDTFPHPQKMKFDMTLSAGMIYDQNTGQLLTSTGKPLQEEKQAEKTEITTVDELKSLPEKIRAAYLHLENYSIVVGSNTYRFVWMSSSNILLHTPSGGQVAYNHILTRIMARVASKPKVFSDVLLKHMNSLSSAPDAVQELLILTFCNEYSRDSSIPARFMAYLQTLQTSSDEELSIYDVIDECKWMKTMDEFRSATGIAKQPQDNTVRRKKSLKKKRKTKSPKPRASYPPLEQAMIPIMSLRKIAKSVISNYDFGVSRFNEEKIKQYIIKVINTRLRVIKKSTSKLSPPEMSALNGFFMGIIREINQLLRERKIGLMIFTEGIKEKYHIKDIAVQEAYEEEQEIDEAEPVMSDAEQEIDEAELGVDDAELVMSDVE